jgi:hypothetical protein
VTRFVASVFSVVAIADLLHDGFGLLKKALDR